jgi:hypothetical protein
MERTQRKAFIGLVALALAAATPALAQDTTGTSRAPQPGQQGNDSLTMPGQGGAADTAGYSGMERDDPTGARDPGARSDTADTGAAPTDTTANQQNQQAAPAGGQTAGQSRDPNGFVWTEPDAWSRAGQTPPTGATDAVQQPAGETATQPGQGGAADTAGYSGMERDTSQKQHKDHKAESDSTKP